VHARLTDVTIKQGGQSKPLAEGLLGYVLPGAVMRWPAPGPLASESALQVRVNGGAQVQSIAPGR